MDFKQQKYEITHFPKRTLQVFIFAFLTRIFLFVFISWFIFSFNNLPYDTSNFLVHTSQQEAPKTLNEMPGKISYILQLLIRISPWDAIYFTYIAQEGYLWEHFYAFFPLFSNFISQLAKCTNLILIRM